MSSLPRWVWDVVADLIEYEMVHPSVKDAESHTWCLAATLERVPPETRSAAEVINDYRRQAG